jgi:hypothetical protein
MATSEYPTRSSDIRGKGTPKPIPRKTSSISVRGTRSVGNGLRGSSVELFEHLFTARNDALFRELYHPGGLRVAPAQPEVLLMLRSGLTAESLCPRSVHARLETGSLPQVEVMRLQVSCQDERRDRRLRAEQAATGGLLDHERVRVVDAEAYLGRAEGIGSSKTSLGTEVLGASKLRRMSLSTFSSRRARSSRSLLLLPDSASNQYYLIQSCTRPVSDCTEASSFSTDLQVFYDNLGLDLSAAYWSVPARLQYCTPVQYWLADRIFSVLPDRSIGPIHKSVANLGNSLRHLLVE